MNNYIRKFRYVVFILGLSLSLATAFLRATGEYEITMSSMWFAVWASIPYIVLLVVSAMVRNNSAIIGAGTLILGLDIFTHIYVIFFPGSSTDVLALLFMPLWLTVLFMPLGFFSGWLIGKVIQRFKREQKEKEDEIFISGSSKS